MTQPSDGTFTSFVISRNGLAVLVMFLLQLVLAFGMFALPMAIGANARQEREQLTSQLHDAESHKRAEAAEMLGDRFSYNSQVKESLKRALQDEKSEVRLAAAVALARSGDFSAGGDMVNALFLIDCRNAGEYEEFIDAMLNSGDVLIESATEEWLTACGYQIEDAGCPNSDGGLRA